MDDLKSKIHAKLQAPTLASFATVTEDGKPWARYVVAWADADLTIWFATFKSSRKVAQIAKNPQVHLNLGVSDMQTAESWVQIQGKAEILDSPAVKKAKWYPQLENIFSGPEDPNYVVCKVSPYRIEHVTMQEKTPQVWTA
jgi:general stress protein 26